MEPKNQVIWTNHCKVISKYISIYFETFQQKLVSSKENKKQILFFWRICIGLRLAFVGNGWERQTRNKKKCFLQIMSLFGTSAFPRSFWSSNPWKPCVSPAKGCINILVAGMMLSHRLLVAGMMLAPKGWFHKKVAVLLDFVQMREWGVPWSNFLSTFHKCVTNKASILPYFKKNFG